MRIILKSNFEANNGVFQKGYIDMPGETTLRQVLDELSRGTGGTMEIIRPRTKEVNPEDFTIVLNGKEYPFLSQRLDTRLKEGDVVEVMITVFGGG